MTFLLGHNEPAEVAVLKTYLMLILSKEMSAPKVVQEIV